MTSEGSGPTSADPRPPTHDHDAPPYGWATLAGGLVLLLYVLTLAPTTAFWDASEYIASAHVLGIPHPPGNPLFVVLAKAWSLLLEPTGLSVAVRINLFSAFMSAAAHGLWFLVVHQVLRSFSTERLFRLAGAGAAVLVSATAFSVWNQSNVNEKVYTVSLLTIALLSWLAIRWEARSARGEGAKILVLMAFILALSVGNHLMAFLAAPALTLFILYQKPGLLFAWRLYPPVIVAALLGLSIHLFLPLRAELGPVMNEGAPQCEALTEALASVATYGATGCQPLSDAINRSQYKVEGMPGPGFSGPRQAPVSAQVANYLQYFDWQWARALGGDNPVFARVRLPLTMLFTGLGIWGLMAHFRHDRATFWYFAALFGTLSVGLLYYMNFKYGYSLRAPLPNRVLHEVRERDYFFIGSFSVWGLWAGIGVACMWREVAETLHTSLRRAAPVLLIAALPLVVNWGWASRADDWAARDWAHNLLMSVEPYGVLFTNGDNDTFPLWYLQEVEGIRQDVTVIVTEYFDTTWYARQIRDISRPCRPGESPEQDPTTITCQRTYTADNTDSVYVDDRADADGKVALLLDAPVAIPTQSVLPIDDELIDRIGQTVVRMERAQVVQLGNVTATLEQGQIVTPWMQYALAVINESLDHRPVYFSSNAGAAADLGLGAHLVRQGLAFKLSPRGPAESRSEAPTTAATDGRAPALRLDESPYLQVTGEWIDVQRTRTLLDQAFVHHAGIPDAWSHWPDHTVSIPHYYAWAYLSVAMAAAQVGDLGSADRYARRSEAWTVLGT
ncbi:MAG: DUF2723 domain-containing protein [Gemmatimonadetes bacterium]|nr:DUF2723 domain-containing protein [Gemmatimonadota bacterium]NNL29415.1 DUF2723 domain-containing protein [Gemmatimonadota bacterium]